MADQDSKYIETEVEIEGRIIKVRIPITEPLPAWETTEVVGKGLARVDAYEKVTGSAHYTLDMNIEGMLFGKILRSPHPSAQVKRIDISKAANTPGVIAILTFEDVKEYTIGSPRNPVPLMTDKIRYAGEEIAALAAVDPYIAEDALNLIEIEYEIKTHVIDPMEAMNSPERRFYPEGNFGFGGFGSGKIGEPNKYERGNVEQGFKDADFIIESQYETSPAQHACMEVHCTAAQWEGEKLTVWDSTQGVYGVQEELANVLHLPLSSIRVIGTHMGGGFGSKSTAHKYALIAALLSSKAHKPVKIALERNEDFISQFYRPSSFQYLKAGVKKNGKLIALYLKAIHQVGAYMFSMAWGNCSSPVKELYACENVMTEDYAVFTNTPTPTAMRAPGHVQGTWALEQFIDEIAEKLKIDPIELRKINYADKDPVTGNDYASKGLTQCIDMALNSTNWNSKKINKEKKNPQKIKTGIGAALQIWGGGGGPPASAIVKINEDGTVNLITGAADIGTGTRTVLSQIVSEELGIPMSLISIINADTAFTTYTLPSYGSITLASSGPATRSAAADAKNQILEFASGLFGAKAADLAIKDSTIYLKKDPSNKKKLNEITALLPNRIILGRGLRGPNPKNKSLRTFGIQIAEVEVNTHTGETKLLKITAVHDCGLVINPNTWKSQIYGGICMGIGYALSEERIYNHETGLHLNPSLLQYKIPTVKDTPIEIIILYPQVKYDANLIGAKGAGEPPIIPTAAAIGNAVYDAIGVRIRSTPITPDKILQALYSLSGGKK